LIKLGFFDHYVHYELVYFQINYEKVFCFLIALKLKNTLFPTQSIYDEALFCAFQDD